MIYEDYESILMPEDKSYLSLTQTNIKNMLLVVVFVN